jgi:small subunit ribosomal protein S15
MWQFSRIERMALAAQDANQEMGLQYWLGRVLDLKNANSRGLLFENKKRILSAFSEPENPHDPGRPEVKGGPVSLRRNHSILTYFYYPA